MTSDLFAIEDNQAVTLEYVSRKKVPPAMIQRVAEELALIVRNQFGGHQGKAAKALGLSQGHVSNLMSPLAREGKGRGPGLVVLLALREHTGRSIDDLLGLPHQGIELGLDRLVEAAHVLESLAARAVPKSETRPQTKRRRG